jgi:hypothetical protein
MDTAFGFVVADTTRVVPLASKRSLFVPSSNTMCGSVMLPLPWGYIITFAIN